MTEVVATNEAVVAGAEVGPFGKLLALCVKGGEEAEAEAVKLTLGMLAETAECLKLAPKLGGEEGARVAWVAEAVRVRWLHEVGEAVGKEDAEEIGVRWVEAFAKAKAAPKGEGFAENLKAELARQAEAREVAQLAVEGSPVEESRAALVPVARALTVIEPPKQEEATVPANETPEERAVREMNDKHAVISNLGGKCVIMEWVPSAISEGQKELSYQSFQAFRERYANQYVVMPNGRGRWETEPFAPIWLAHPHRRQYEGLDLVPNGPPILPNGYLNLWKGWGVEPRKGSWRLMQRHIAEVLANGNQVFEDFIKRSTAWKFQNAGLPPEVVLALLGGKGAGKGAWGYIQMLIYGPHALQIFSTDHLTGKHNQHLQNKLFLFLDEALWAGNTQADRMLKGLTTEKWMLIEPKWGAARIIETPG
jgi:hypothetical protein